MSGLTEFLLARIAEDEADAQANRGTYPSAAMLDDGYLALHVQYGGNAVIVRYPRPVEGDGDVDALRRWASPEGVGWAFARVLAECEAKRRILERHTQKTGANLPRHPICAECGGADWRPEGGVLQPFPWVMPWPCHTLRLLALPYADHPDYRQEWRP